MSLAGRSVVQLALPTSDLARARRFYGEVLGLQFLFETNGMLFFQLGNTRLMVGSNAEGDLAPRDGSAIYFDAPDLPELSRVLEQQGLVFEGPAETLQRTEAGNLQLRFFRDPDGNLLALMGVVKPAA